MGNGVSSLSSVDLNQEPVSSVMVQPVTAVSNLASLPFAQLVPEERTNLTMQVAQAFECVYSGRLHIVEMEGWSVDSKELSLRVANKFLFALSVVGDSFVNAEDLTQSAIEQLASIIKGHVEKFSSIYPLTLLPGEGKSARYNAIDFFVDIRQLELLISDSYSDLIAVFGMIGCNTEPLPLLPAIAGESAQDFEFKNFHLYLESMEICFQSADDCAMRLLIAQIRKHSHLPLHLHFSMIRAVNSLNEYIDNLAQLGDQYIIRQLIDNFPESAAILVFLASNSQDKAKRDVDTFLSNLEGYAGSIVGFVPAPDMLKPFVSFMKSACNLECVHANLVMLGFLDRMDQSIFDLYDSELFAVWQPLLQSPEVLGMAKENIKLFFKIESPDPSPASPKAQSRLQQSGRLSSLSTSAIRLHFNDPKATAPERDNHVRTSPSTNGL